MSATFPLLGVQILLHCNLVLYEVGGCARSSCHAHAWSGLFSFGDVNNAPKCLAKFPLSLII